MATLRSCTMREAFSVPLASRANKRITLGVYVTDGYRDTVEDGIAIVKEYIEGLAKDEKTKACLLYTSRCV